MNKNQLDSIVSTIFMISKRLLVKNSIFLLISSIFFSMDKVLNMSLFSRLWYKINL